MTDQRLDDTEVRRRLAELEAASDERRREMRAVLDDLPAALSRRRLVTAALADLKRAPNKLDGLFRGVRKLGRILVRRS